MLDTLIYEVIYKAVFLYILDTEHWEKYHVQYYLSTLFVLQLTVNWT